MKAFLKKCLNALLAFMLRLVSRRLKVKLIMKLLDSAVEKVSAEEALRFLFGLDSSIYSMEGKAAVAYGKGIHTKHRHIKYHDFFIRNIKSGERVLDIGSGIGYMCDNIAGSVKAYESLSTYMDT